MGLDISSRTCTFVKYQSQLLIIGGYVKTTDGSHMCLFNRDVYKLDEDKGWFLSENISKFPDGLNPVYGVSATSEGSLLIVSWVGYEHFWLLISQGQSWRRILGPSCTADVHELQAIVLDGTLYLHNSKNNSIDCASLDSLLSAKADEFDPTSLWKSLPRVPWYNASSNLTIFDASIITIVLPGSHYGTACLLGFQCSSNSWIELGEVTCRVDIQQSPIIVGLQPDADRDAKLLIMGRIKVETTPKTSYLDVPRFSVLEVSTSGMSLHLDMFCYFIMHNIIYISF